MTRRSKRTGKGAGPPTLDYAGGDARRGRAAFGSRGLVIAVSAVVAAGVVLHFSAEAVFEVISVLLVDGLLAVVWIAAAAMLGSALLKLFGCITAAPGCAPVAGGDFGEDGGAQLKAAVPRVSGALYWTTAAGIGLGVFSLAALGLGLAGLLNQATTVLLPVIGIAAGVWANLGALRRWREHVESVRMWLRAPAEWQWLSLAAALMLGMAVVAAAILPGVLWRPDDPHPYDSLSYHLQVPREWFELGRIVPLEHNVFSFFPFGVEMQFLLAMHVRGGPWAGMYLGQFISLGYGVLMVLAVYGACRAIAPEMRGQAIIAAVAAANVPWVMMLATVTYVEAGLMLYTALAVGWAVVAVRSEHALRAWAVAGVMAGLACGVKYTAVPMLLAAVPVALVGAAALRRMDLGAAVRGGALYVVLGALIFSPWLMRNVAWSGNPVFPLAMSVLGQAHFIDEQVERWELAHRLPVEERGASGRLVRTWRQILADWQYAYLFLPLAFAAMLWQVKRPGGLVLVLLFGVMFIVWLGFTHLVSRFFVMAIPVAAIAIGTAPWRGWRSLAAAAVVLAMSLMGWTHLYPRLERFAEFGRDGLFGVTDLGFLSPPGFHQRYEPGVHVALVGDAAAFFYQIPMAQLTYRTVFDIRAAEARDWIHAWVEDDVPADKRLLLVINPMEVERLSRTYHAAPGLPVDYTGPRDRAFVVWGADPGQLK